MTMQRAKTVAVYSGSGGAGKSLLAANLAVSLHLQDSGRVLFVDAGHPIPGDAIALVGLERAKSLGEMAPILGRLTPEIFASYLLRAPSGLSVLPLVGDVLQARQVTPELLAKMMELASAAFDLIIVDMPTGVTNLTQAMLDRSDYVCVIGEPTPSGIARTRHSLDYLRSLQFPQREHPAVPQSRAGARRRRARSDRTRARHGAVHLAARRSGGDGQRREPRAAAAAGQSASRDLARHRSARARNHHARLARHRDRAGGDRREEVERGRDPRPEAARAPPPRRRDRSEEGRPRLSRAIR